MNNNSFIVKQYYLHIYMNQEYNDSIKIITVFLTFLILFLGIFTSQVNEVMKYFAVNMILLVVVVIYFQMVLGNRIRKLEEQN